jgi:predicted permease
MRQAAAAVPGVESAAASAVTPVSGMMWNLRIELPEHPSMPEKERVVLVNLVTPDYFRTYGSRILAGRDFTPVDRLGSPGVSIVNEAFARKFYNGENPVGRVFAEEGSPGTPSVPRQIVGYVENVVYLSLRDPMTPTIYTPLAQADELQWSAGISVRASSDRPILLTKPIAAALVAVDPHATLTFRALDDQISASLVQERVVAILAGFFGGLALLLAGLGLYGVTSYTVSRRRTEIGVRMALGAAPGGVVRMVLRRVALLVALGVVVGAGVSLWASRFIATLLYGLEPRDPVTLIGAALVLGAIGALAGWLPARRAARIDPTRVLREG